MIGLAIRAIRRAARRGHRARCYNAWAIMRGQCDRRPADLGPGGRVGSRAVGGSTMDHGSRVRVFVSAAPTDRAFAALLCRALRESGVDVWLETTTVLAPNSERELRARPIFLAVLSEQALACEAVRDACGTA